MSSKNDGIRLLLPYAYEDASPARDALLKARESQQVQFDFVVCEGGTLIVGFNEPPNETDNGEAVQRIAEEASTDCCYIPVQTIPNLGQSGDFDPCMTTFTTMVGQLLQSLTPSTTRLALVYGRYWAIADRFEEQIVLEVGFGGQRLIADVADRAHSFLELHEAAFDLHYRGRAVQVDPGDTASDIDQLIESAISTDLVRELAKGAAAMLLQISMLSDGPLPEEFEFYQKHLPGRETNPYEEGLVFRVGGFSVTRNIFAPKDDKGDQASDPATESTAPDPAAPEIDPLSESTPPEP